MPPDDRTDRGDRSDGTDRTDRSDGTDRTDRSPPPNWSDLFARTDGLEVTLEDVRTILRDRRKNG